MPNYVRNIIQFQKTAESANAVNALFAAMISLDDQGKQYFDFNKLKPMPESLDIESGGEPSLASSSTSRCCTATLFL